MSLLTGVAETVILPDGTTVYLDDQGRVITPPPPSAWDIFWQDPIGELGYGTYEGTRRVVAGTGEILGQGVAATAVGAATGASEGVSRGIQSSGGLIVLVGAIVLVVLVMGRR